MTDSANLSSTSSSQLNKIIYAIAGVAVLGFIDATYLTVAYYQHSIKCSTIAGCTTVLNSSYSSLWGIPTALLGVAYYLVILFLALSYSQNKNLFSIKALKIIPTTGFLFSLWLVYLQLFVIDAICIYCMGSALTSTLIFILSLLLVRQKPSHV